jgi:uncharacterized protein YjbI with pentapeptide repeats
MHLESNMEISNRIFTSAFIGGEGYSVVLGRLSRVNPVFQPNFRESDSGANSGSDMMEFVNSNGDVFHDPRLRSIRERDANLSGADLRNATLRPNSAIRLNLQDADLSGANFVGGNMSDTNFNGANLSGAKLSNAQSGRRLVASHSQLVNANLSGADCSGTDFSGANLSGANLARAQGLSVEQLANATWDERTVFPTDLRNLPATQSR